MKESDNNKVSDLELYFWIITLVVLGVAACFMWPKLLGGIVTTGGGLLLMGLIGMCEKSPNN